MVMDTSTKRFAAFLPFVLPFFLILPYAFIASEYRGLLWVWETNNIPFWAMLSLLSILAILSSVLIFQLMDIGYMLFRAGVVLAMAHGAFLAMSERRHPLLILVFLLFTLGIFLSEKVKRTLNKPYYHSKRNWWESYPKGIPGLVASIVSEDGKRMECRISNLGVDGCFVFSRDMPILYMPDRIEVYSGDKILLEAKVDEAIKTRDSFGLGLRFSARAVGGDWNKDLEDYLNYLRRSGYEVV